MRKPNKTPRVAYCTGCQDIFLQHHQLINHRRTFRCGGRFLTPDQRAVIDFAHERGEKLKDFRPGPVQRFKIQG